MNGAAPSSRLMQSIRAGFQQQGNFGLTPAVQPLAEPATPPVTPPTEAVSSPVPSLQDQLQVLDQVLTEVEQTRVTAPAPTYDPAAQVVPQVIAQATDTLNSTPVGYTSPAAKETLSAAAPVETATGLQYVEEEKVPEIPVEVEGYLQRVEQHADQLPQEIVIADVAQAPLANHYAKQPVIVLPITPEIEASGAKKGPAQSVRWLVEFSRKIMKMFAGKVVYREVPSQEA